MAEEEQIPLVFDLGSGRVHCGWAGDDFPRGTFENVIGCPRSPNLMIGLNYRESYVGDAAQQYRGVLSLKYPIENGVITSVDTMEAVFHHAFYNELRVHPEEHNALLTEPPFNPRSHRIGLTQLLFETFNVPGLYFAFPALLACSYGSRYTSLVLDIGEGVTTISPIIEGRLIKAGVIRTNFAGKALTNYLARLMTQRGYYLNRSSDLDATRTIKEKLCYVPLDYKNEIYESTIHCRFRREHELSDGTPIMLEYERFQCPEALFQPSFAGLEIPGIHELLDQSINKTSVDDRKVLMANIYLSGGSTLFPGIADRLHREMSKLAAPNTKVRIIATPERRLVTWCGASMGGTFPSLNWITKQEYDEYGPSIAFKKCDYM